MAFPGRKRRGGGFPWNSPRRFSHKVIAASNTLASADHHHAWQSRRVSLSEGVVLVSSRVRTVVRLTPTRVVLVLAALFFLLVLSAAFSSPSFSRCSARVKVLCNFLDLITRQVLGQLLREFLEEESVVAFSLPPLARMGTRVLFFFFFFFFAGARTASWSKGLNRGRALRSTVVQLCVLGIECNGSSDGGSCGCRCRCRQRDLQRGERSASFSVSSQTSRFSFSSSSSLDSPASANARARSALAFLDALGLRLLVRGSFGARPWPSASAAFLAFSALDFRIPRRHPRTLGPAITGILVSLFSWA